jgi:hypothetical protein
VPLLVAVAAIGSIAAGSADAKPAVDTANLRWLNVYEFEYLDSDDVVTRIPPGGTVIRYRPESKKHLFLSRLALTLPITERIGGRVRAGGGAQRSDDHYDVDLAFIPDVDRDIWSWQVEAGADLFARDPDLGYVDLGYTYTHQHFNDHPDVDQRSQTGILATGLYLSPAKLPPIDLDIRFAYERVSVHRNTNGSTWPVYNLEATMSLYLGERVRWSTGARFSYADVDPQADRWIRDTRALIRLLWLPPIGDQSFLTLGLRATGGEIHEHIRTRSFDRAVTSVGIEVGVIYPGGDSLVQLVRERF